MIQSATSPHNSGSSRAHAAIDEDDNPYEAAFKTTIEGFGLGFGADASGAFIGGHRAYRKAIKEGLEKEAAEKLAKAMQD